MHIPGEERREERRERRHARRLIHAGEIVNSDELDDVDLEEVEPAPEPDNLEEEAEPWETTKDLPTFGARVAEYAAFLAAWREEHADGS